MLSCQLNSDTDKMNDPSANLDATVESFQDEKIDLKIQKSNPRNFIQHKKI